MKFGSIKVVQFRHFSLKYLYQARKVRDHVCVCVMGNFVAYVSANFPLDFGTDPTAWYFFHFMIMSPSVWFKRICLAF